MAYIFDENNDNLLDELNNFIYDEYGAPPVKSVTQWQAPAGIGYVNITNNNVYLNPVGNQTPLANIIDNLGNVIITNSGDSLQINTNIFSFKSPTAWDSVYNEYIQGSSYSTYGGPSPAQWIPKGGYGYVYTSLDYQAAGDQAYPIVPGANQITDNFGNFFTDNSGNYLVTNDIVVVGKNPTLWEASGA